MNSSHSRQTPPPKFPTSNAATSRNRRCRILFAKGKETLVLIHTLTTPHYHSCNHHHSSSPTSLTIPHSAHTPTVPPNPKPKLGINICIASPAAAVARSEVLKGVRYCGWFRRVGMKRREVMI